MAPPQMQMMPDQQAQGRLALQPGGEGLALPRLPRLGPMQWPKAPDPSTYFGAKEQGVGPQQPAPPPPMYLRAEQVAAGDLPRPTRGASLPSLPFKAAPPWATGSVAPRPPQVLLQGEWLSRHLLLLGQRQFRCNPLRNGVLSQVLAPISGREEVLPRHFDLQLSSILLPCPSVAPIRGGHASSSPSCPGPSGLRGCEELLLGSGSCQHCSVQCQA